MTLQNATALVGAKNVRLAATEAALFVYCDLSQSFGLSSSGKSTVIASSSGNRPLGKSNAFLGLNLFAKSLDKVDLTDVGIAPLQKDAFTEVSDGFSWRIEEDKKTLCMRVSFADIKERPASSGKSVLLATSGGNKAVGGTGIMCGFNAYRPTQSTFEPSALAEEAAAGQLVKLGDTATLAGGFTIRYVSASSVEVSLHTTIEALKSTKVLSSPKDVRLENGTTMMLYVGLPAAKRARSSSPHDATPPTAEPNEKAHNCTFSCLRDPPESETLIVCVTFDPTQAAGRTASAKSFAVSSSAGFQVLHNASRHPLCRASFNAYRPAPTLDDALIQSCVKELLAAQPDNQVEKMTMKELMRGVMESFQLQDTHKDLIRKPVEQAALSEIVRIRSQGSQSSTE